MPTVESSDNYNPGIMKFLFRSFRYRNYRLFFAGQGISLIGTWIQNIAMSWLVYKLTNSAFLLGIVGFAGQIPTFLLTPVAGVMADRWNRHRILVTTQILSMVQALLLAALILSGKINVGCIIALSVMLGLVNSFDIPVRQSFVVDIIENREDLGNAIALNSSMFNGARLLGPAVAGILISAVGEGICFLINGISYIAVIAALLSMKAPPVKPSRGRGSILPELKEGFIYAVSYRPIRYVILFIALVSLTSMPYAVLMPVFAGDILQGGAHTLGFLMGFTGAGALLGAVFLASRGSPRGLLKFIPVAGAVFGLGLIAFSFSRVMWLSSALLAVAGFGMMVHMASSNTVLQTLVEDEKRGRIMSFYTMAFMGMVPLGSLLAGTLAEAIGAPYTLTLGGGLSILGALLFAGKTKSFTGAAAGDQVF